VDKKKTVLEWTVKMLGEVKECINYPAGFINYHELPLVDQELICLRL
jgi:hypothetical protein